MDFSLPTTVIVNPASGRGKGESAWEMFSDALKAKGVLPEILFSSQEEGKGLADLARRVTEKEGPMNLLVAGGDGSMQEVLSGIRDFSAVCLGALPTGSSNDFLRALGQRNPATCVKAILEAKGVHLRDGLWVTAFTESGDKKEHLALVSSGFGFDAATCAMANESPLKGVLNRVGLGDMIYVLVAVGIILRSPLYPMEVSVFTGEGELKEKKTFQKTLFGAVMNNTYEGGGYAMYPGAVGDDGIINGCVAADVSRLGYLSIIPKAAKAAHGNCKGVHLSEGTAFELCSQKPLYYHVDGEVPGKALRLQVKVLPGLFRFWN